MFCEILRDALSFGLTAIAPPKLLRGQLMGTIVSPGNQYISISNPSADTISVLTWNYIFDNAMQLPDSFNVNDDRG